MNQVSSVNDCAPPSSPIVVGVPNVTRLLVPLNFSPVLAAVALTVMVTLALALALLLSVAVRLSTYAPAAEKVAVVASTFAFPNVTVPGPLTLAHSTLAMVPSLSVAEPESDAVAGSVMVWFVPALTTGG